jgi:hypothetical protein
VEWGLRGARITSRAADHNPALSMLNYGIVAGLSTAEGWPQCPHLCISGASRCCRRRDLMKPRVSGTASDYRMTDDERWIAKDCEGNSRVLIERGSLSAFAYRDWGKPKQNLSQGSREAVSRRLTTAAAWILSGSWHVGFMVDKVTLGQVFSECYGFPYQLSFHRLLTFIIIYHLALVQ